MTVEGVTANRRRPAPGPRDPAHRVPRTPRPSSCSDSSSTARRRCCAASSQIVTTRDALLTDYFGIGGIGAGCVNAGLLTLCACLVYHLAQREDHRRGGRLPVPGPRDSACSARTSSTSGRSSLGVFLYARFRGEPFATHINTAFFGAALAPVFSEILFSTTLALEFRVPLAIVTSLVIGFILAPAAAQLFKAHMGFSLYNMGFTAGIVGTLVVAMYKSYGFVPDPVMIWTTGNNRLLGGFLAVRVRVDGRGRLLPRSRAAVAAEADHGGRPARRRPISSRSPASAPTLANMGLTGAIGMVYVLPIGGDLNGPVIGAILTIVGFAAFGKHPRNIVPIMARRVPRVAGQAVERRRSVDPAGRAVRHDARADRRTLRLALGHRRRDSCIRRRR